MSIRPILLYPDAGLRQRAIAITEFGADTAELAQDLLDTMRAAPGIGITAPHIGILKRLTVIELPGDEAPRIYVNPVISWRSEESRQQAEGSVSMPGMTEMVERPTHVRVAYQDLAGQERMEEADGLLAICLQHEIDQLDGIFWLQRLSRLRRDRVIRKFEKTS